MLSAARMLATVGVWSFGAMIVIAAVLAIAAFIEDTWPGSVITAAAPNPERHADSARSSLRVLRGHLWGYGWFGRLAWAGMWCGLIAAFGVFVGAPWAALEERAMRQAREAAEEELVTRRCGDLLMIPLPSRVTDAIIRDSPEVMDQFARSWAQYRDCRSRLLGLEASTLD
jgi:hypothetical protein